MLKVIGGSVCGTEHDRNQDAIGWLQKDPDTVFGVVCDGCGEKSGSHVGSTISVELLAQSFSEMSSTLRATAFVRELQKRYLEKLSGIANFLGGALRTRDSAIEEYLLCTIVGFFITKRTSIVFAAGDGVYSFNGEPPISLGPFPDNAPPYLAYNLYSTPQINNLQIVSQKPTSKLQSLFVGSDGVLHMPNGGTDVAADMQLFNSGTSLNRALRKLNAEKVELQVQSDPQNVVVRPKVSFGELEDDTSIVMVKKEVARKTPVKKAPHTRKSSSQASAQPVSTGYLSRSWFTSRNGGSNGDFID